jgi:mannose-1-phosphate guanylyltransferase
MIINNFYQDVLRDYKKNIDIEMFFDSETGAVYEPGREDGTPKFLFTEVTGYAILDFLLLHAITGDEAYLARARKCADWIINAGQDPCGGVLTRFYFDQDHRADLSDMSFAGRRIFAFDTAICLKGLAALYDATQGEQYLKSANAMAKFLTEKLMPGGQKVYALYDAKHDMPLEDDRQRWSRRFGAFHSKVAEALVDLYAATREESYRSAAEAICTQVLTFQARRGNFETSLGRTDLHPHGYAVEGLLHVGAQLRNDDFVAAARRATEWALDQCRDGEIAQDFEFETGAPRSRYRTDALAQILALAADLFRMGQLDRKYLATMDELASKILQMKSARGYFRYGYYQQEFKNGVQAETLSYWTNMFCLRGLYKYYVSYVLDHTYVVILAGGIGSRCWPISCENMPKPLSFSLLGDRTLLQETIRRFTHDFFLKPTRVFVLGTEQGLAETKAQAAQEGIPEHNIVVEKIPMGTIPATMQALKALPQDQDHERLIVISMADNIIEPYRRVQHSLIAALFAAREVECIVSIGKPIDLQSKEDRRFGHMVYSDAIGAYRVHNVDRFEEKPDHAMLLQLRGLPGKLAWECGSIVFQERYYQSAAAAFTEGNLAKDLLSTAGKPDGIKMAVSRLDAAVRFEDMGVPGSNLLKFWRGSKYDRGNGNICLGTRPRVQLLSCTGNLIIADQLPIQVYGLRDCLIIDNAMTNTAVVMPLNKVDTLPTLYRMLKEPETYKAFIAGGDLATKAAPASSVVESPASHADSDFGLAFIFGCKEKISMRREPKRLWIVNEEYPELEIGDFEILEEKEREDPKLVEHLIHVTALAESFLGGNIVLSDLGRKALKLLCLYHDYGGYLNEEVVKKEEDIVSRFKKASKLNRRLLDSRIICELLRLHGGEISPLDEAKIGLFDDSVNSAVQLLRRRAFDDHEIRDIIVFLLQAQDSPNLFVDFKKTFKDMGFSRLENEVEIIFACLKIAEIFANGRWLWKKKFHHSIARQDTDSLTYREQQHEASFEDFLYIISFILKTLDKAGIAPNIYVDRLNEAFLLPSSFLRLIASLQENKPLLVADELYLYLIGTREPSAARVQEILTAGIASASRHADEVFQLTQIAEAPTYLAEIEPHCTALTKPAVEMVTRLVVELYHQNWRLFKRQLSADVINRLLSRELQLQ